MHADLDQTSTDTFYDFPCVLIAKFSASDNFLHLPPHLLSAAGTGDGSVAYGGSACVCAPSIRASGAPAQLAGCDD